MCIGVFALMHLHTLMGPCVWDTLQLKNVQWNQAEWAAAGADGKSDELIGLIFYGLFLLTSSTVGKDKATAAGGEKLSNMRRFSAGSMPVGIQGVSIEKVCAELTILWCKTLLERSVAQQLSMGTFFILRPEEKPGVKVKAAKVGSGT